jgi:two-component system cell cycle sensor histidine kinase/response regulator CckA
MDKRQRILIVDDNPNIREGLQSLLSPHQGFDIVGVACDGLEAIQAVDQFLPDLVLMDLSMPRMGGIAATREIKGQHPETKILALTVHKTEEYITAALKAGADGYILKDTPHAELIQSIEKTLGGMRVLSLGVEEALRESEERFRAVFESAAVGIEQRDLEGHFRKGNDKFSEIIGLTQTELRQRTLEEITLLEDRQQEKPLVEQLLKGERPFYTIEKRFIHKNGHPVWTRVTTSLAKNLLKPYRISIIEDITERKQTEEALKKSEEKYRDLVENINDVIFEIDENQRISYISPTSEATIGLPPSDLIGRSMMDFLFPEDRSLAGESFQKNSSGQALPIEVRLVNQFEEIRWVRVSSRPITKMGRVLGFRGILTDLTEEKRRDEERMIMSKLESTGILAGGIAHDFNNLLTVILGNLELAKISPGITKTLGTYLENAEKAVTSARTLTQQFITFAKGDAPVKRLITLTGLLKEQARYTLRGSPVGYKCTISPDLWSTDVDENQIGQVLRNIILNAREAMPQGGKILIGAINWVVDASSDLPLPEGNYVRVTIADRGSGISEEVLPKIFDPYFSTRQRGDQKGMGLGLTICHSVIQKHGGAITVSSKTGEGTIFHVYLPALPLRINERPALPQGLPGMGRILVMDDEEMMLNLVGEILSHLGYEIQPVEDGEKALACFREAQDQGNPFDAVILDLIVSGGMGGKETIEELLKIDPSVKAIVSSGYSNDPVMVEYDRYGFKGALAKPYGINDLRDILSNVIGIDQFIKAGP